MNQTVIQGLKWLAKSVGGLLANLKLLTLWVEYANLSPAIAIIPNFFIISVVGYTVTNRWIWPDGVTPSNVRGHLTQYAGMQAANAGGKMGNYAVFLVLLPFVDYRVAWVIGAGVTFLITFSLNKRWWERSMIPQSA